MLFGGKKKKLQRIIEILSDDVKALYKINRKYSFTNDSMFDDYNKFYFNIDVLINKIIMMIKMTLKIVYLMVEIIINISLIIFLENLIKHHLHYIL